MQKKSATADLRPSPRSRQGLSLGHAQTCPDRHRHHRPDRHRRRHLAGLARHGAAERRPSGGQATDDPGSARAGHTDGRHRQAGRLGERGQANVAPGLAIQAFATGLDHPRWLYELPNGDVLVAETNSPPRPSAGIVDRVMNFFLGRAGAAVPSANRITLLRDTNGDGKADLKTPFLTGLNSPFGMVLFDGQLYIADTDALVRVPYVEGTTKITATPKRSCRCGAVAIIGAQRHRLGDGQTLYVSVGSASNIADNGLDAEKNRAAILQFGRRTRTGASMRRACAIRPAWRSTPSTASYGPSSTSATCSARTCARLSDAGRVRRSFRLALVLLGRLSRQSGSARQSSAPAICKAPGLCAGAACRGAGPDLRDRHEAGRPFANGAFIGEHGSWNRKPPSGYKVVFVPFGPGPSRRPRPSRSMWSAAS